MFILFESLKNKSSLTKLIIFVSATRYKYTFSIKHYLLLREDLSFVYILIHTWMQFSSYFQRNYS